MHSQMFNARITVLRRVGTGGYNDQIDWQPLLDAAGAVLKVWANIRNRSGLATISADAVTSKRQTSIRIRKRNAVEAGMRVQHGQTVYEVREVLPDEARGEFCDLVCEAIDAGR